MKAPGPIPRLKIIKHEKTSSSPMITLLVATVGLAFFYGALWHNEPARSQNREKQDEKESTRPLELLATLSAVNARRGHHNE